MRARSPKTEVTPQLQQRILDLLNQDLSQAIVATRLSVPRSVVARISVMAEKDVEIARLRAALNYIIFRSEQDWDTPHGVIYELRNIASRALETPKKKSL